MKLSTKSTYGLRAMVNIAMEKDKCAISIREISKREGISSVYLEQLLNKLRRENLVKSVRGPSGGYMLSRAACRITVADIVKTLEGSIVPVDCASGREGYKSVCHNKNTCVAKTVWAKLAKAIEDCLKSVTLADLCDKKEIASPAPSLLGVGSQ
ncbi:MAG: Rrf2 family transcriptional regulator [Candidatus Omnitrophica bacterium]|nr:Rrf2 family transcriptional regulator [Candidatus Omnitrophota bacterium]